MNNKKFLSKSSRSSSCPVTAHEAILSKYQYQFYKQILIKYLIFFFQTFNVEYLKKIKHFRFNNLIQKGYLCYPHFFGNGVNYREMRQCSQMLSLLRTSIVDTRFLSDVNYCFSNSLINDVTVIYLVKCLCAIYHSVLAAFQVLLCLWRREKYTV